MTDLAASLSRSTSISRASVMWSGGSYCLIFDGNPFAGSSIRFEASLSLIPPQLLFLKGHPHLSSSDIRHGRLVQWHVWNLEFKWPMNAFDVTMQARPAKIVRFTVLASNGPHVEVWLMIDAVMEPAIHIQVLAAAIGFVGVVVVNREDVAVFQIGKPAVVAPEQFF